MMTDQQRAELKALADGAKGWSNCNQAWLDTSEDTACATFGHITEDGVTYPLGVIDCDYSGDSLLVAKYYAAANPASVLALLADLEEAEAARRKAQDSANEAWDQLRSAEAELATVCQQLAEAQADLAGVLLPLQEACDLLGMRRHDSAKEQARAMASRLLNDRTVIASLELRLKAAVAPYKRDAELIDAVFADAIAALESCTPEDFSTGHVIHQGHDEDLVEKALRALHACRKTSLSAKEPPFNFDMQSLEAALASGPASDADMAELEQELHAEKENSNG